MKTAGKFIYVFSCITAIVGLHAAGPRAAAEQRKWFTVQTRHYNIRTDISPAVANVVSKHMEAIYAEYHRRMANLPRRGKTERFDIVIFKNPADYAEFVGEAGKNSTGMFLGHKNALASFGGEQDLDRILAGLRHEGFHQFATGFIGPQVPIWLNEGMAVFFENSEWTSRGLKIGLVPVGRLRTLKQARADGTLIPIAQMLDMSDEEWAQNVRTGQDRGTLQYAQAWSMVHFLVYGDNGKYRRHLERYIYKIASGQSAKAAFDDVFAGDAKGFEKRWLAYIDGLKLTDYLPCQLRLKILLQLLDACRDDPNACKDMQTFYQAAVEQKLGKWKIATSDGLEIRSDDIAAIKDLFLCPNDKGSKQPYSYEFQRQKDGEAGLPDIICRHHPGMIYRATFVKNEETGEMEPQILTLPASHKNP